MSYGFRQISSLVRGITQPLHQKSGGAILKLRLEWPAIVGPEWVGLLEPLKITSRVHQGQRRWCLWAQTTSAASLIVHYAEADLMERINRYFGRCVIDEIRLTHRDPSPVAVVPPQVSLSGEQKEAIAACVRTLPNADLREALERFGTALVLSKKSIK